MKRILYFIFVLILVFAITGCKSVEPIEEKTSIQDRVEESMDDYHDWSDQLDMAKAANFKIYDMYGYEFEIDGTRYIPKEGQNYQYYVQKAIQDGLESEKLANSLYVYVYKDGGLCYHSLWIGSECKEDFDDQKRYPITLAEALEQGYMPCPQCVD